MAQSPEYPQYKLIPPRSWSSGRPNGAPRWIVIHSTEGSEGPRSAEDGAAYDQRRTDGTSAHFYVDSDSVVQCVRTTDRAHTAAYHGNLWGIHIEVCGRHDQTPRQWDDPVSQATIEQLAGLCRALRGRYPFPLQRLSPVQLKGADSGYCRHYDISLAWGESDHTDPGSGFPWKRLFSLINGDEEDEMTPAQAWVLHVINYRTEAIKANRVTINIPARPDLGAQYKAMTEPNNLAAALTALASAAGSTGSGEVLAMLDEMERAETARHAELRDIVAQGVSGQLDAESVVARMGELLGAAGDPS